MRMALYARVSTRDKDQNPETEQPDFRDAVKEHPNDFTRHRKLGFVDVMAIIFNLIRDTTQIEVDDFGDEFVPEQAKQTSYTKQSFAEARQKIRPEAFMLLNSALMDRYYAEPDYQTFLGFGCWPSMAVGSKSPISTAYGHSSAWPKGGTGLW